MKQTTITLLVLLLRSALLFSQKNLLQEVPQRMVFANGQPAPAQQARGASLTEALDLAFDSIAGLTPIKGFNAALLLPDGTYWKRAEGLSQKLPISQNLTTEHLMAMGSISKSFVAVALLRLQEEGLLDLDDSIGMFLPSYPNISGAATVRQLLGHRTGFSDYLNENPAMLDALLNNIDSIWVADTVLSHYVLPPNFALGTNWSYSNTNFLLAGRVIEVVTGQAWHQVVREKVIDPMGLTHTFVYPWETPGTQPFAHIFADLDGQGDLDDWQGLGLPDAGLFSLAGSAGCLISNPEDLAKFSQQVHSGQLLQAVSLAEMQTDFIQNGSGFMYGLGAASFPNPYDLENWGHDGDLLYKSVALYFPEIDIALAVQQNDDRNHDPMDAASPEYDLYGMFQTLLDAYLKFTQVVSAPEPGFAKTAAFSVSPNPVSGSFRVRFSEKNTPEFPVSVLVSDVSGRALLSQSIENESQEVDIRQLPAGVYILRVGSGAAKVLKY